MGEFKKFIKDLKKMGFGYVGMEEVFADEEDNAKLIDIDEIINIFFPRHQNLYFWFRYY